MYNADMAKHVIDMSEAEATRDFTSLLARVREGAEVVIKDGTRPVAVVRPAEPMSGCSQNLFASPESTARPPRPMRILRRMWQPPSRAIANH